MFTQKKGHLQGVSVVQTVLPFCYNLQTVFQLGQTVGFLVCFTSIYDLYSLGRDDQTMKCRSTAILPEFRWCLNFHILLPNPQILSSGAKPLLSLNTFHILWEGSEVQHFLNVRFLHPHMSSVSLLLSLTVQRANRSRSSSRAL